jgi:hypothetical protein
MYLLRYPRGLEPTPLELGRVDLRSEPVEVRKATLASI